MNQRFYVLDSFRGIAAVFVVIHHMHYIGSITEWNFFKNSDLFVDFFFVLSGFVLTHSYAFKKELNFKNFFIARTFRIVPLHVVMLMIFILLEFGKLLAYHYGFPFNTEPFTNHAEPISIIPNLFLLQSWFPNTFAIGWNSPSWSISIEYYMYMIFFITLLIVKPKQYIAWTILSIVSFYIIFMHIELWTNFDKISRGLSSFFAGSLTYLIYKEFAHKLTIKNIYFTIIESVLLILIIYMISSDFSYKHLLMSCIFCLQIFIFSFEKGLVSNIFKQRFFQLLGSLSYSIYMIHAALLFIFFSFTIIIQKILHRTFVIPIDNVPYLDFSNPVFNNMIILIFVFIVIICSHFTYKYIEQIGQIYGKKIRKID